MALTTRCSEIILPSRELVLDAQYPPLGPSDRTWEQWPQMTLELERTHGILFTFPASQMRELVVEGRELCPGTCSLQSGPVTVPTTAHYKVNVTLCLAVAKMI